MPQLRVEPSISQIAYCSTSLLSVTLFYIKHIVSIEENLQEVTRVIA
jgi:hypothetical protein